MEALGGGGLFLMSEVRLYLSEEGFLRDAKDADPEPGGSVQVALENVNNFHLLVQNPSTFPIMFAIMVRRRPGEGGSRRRGRCARARRAPPRSPSIYAKINVYLHANSRLFTRR